MMTDRQIILEKLEQENSFYLFSHMFPDGDSIGSLLAVGEGLLLLGKEVKMFTPGHIPRKYTFLKGSEKVFHEAVILDPTVTAIVLDSSDLERLDVFKQIVMDSASIINIDHHVTNQRFGHLNLVDPKAAATGEIIFHILQDLKIKLNESIAEALYVAISTDTGSFKYENTMPETHRVAAALLEYNLSPGTLSQKIFDEHPLSFYILLREALSTLELYEDQRIAVMTLSKDIRERCGANTDDLEGIVNYSRNVEGIELGILFYIDSEKEVKVGFRSKTLDVSVLAGKFNGGGHARAAGCRIYSNFETAKNNVMHEACGMLNKLPA